MGRIEKEHSINTETNAFLGGIKPSATKLILDGSKIDVIDTIKLAFFDLIVKQVLRVKKEFRKAHSRHHTLREYIVVEMGSEFSKYKPDRFESYFLDIINKNSFYYLKNYLRKVYENLPSNYRCYRYVIDGSNINGNFNSSVFTKVFRLTILNRKGKIFRKEIKSYLDVIDNKILDLLDNNPEKVLKIINELKGNIFLLKNIKFELLGKLKPLLEENKAYNDDILHVFCMDDYFDEIFDTITDTLESIDVFIHDNDSSDWDEDFDF